MDDEIGREADSARGTEGFTREEGAAADWARDAALDRRGLLRRAGFGVAAAGAAGIVAPAATGLPSPARRNVFNVVEYGAQGNGLADDTSALRSAIGAAQAARGLLFAPPGHTFRISSRLVISGQCHVDFSHSTIKKEDGWAGGPALTVAAEKVAIRRLSLDGNRPAGPPGGGIVWEAAEGLLEDSLVASTRGAGVAVGSAGILDCVRCTSVGNVNGARGAADDGRGFLVLSGGILRTYACTAHDNGQVGFFFDSTAGDGCSLDGSACRNGYVGASVRSANGRCSYFFGEDNDFYGIEFVAGANRWRCDFLDLSSNGVKARNLGDGSGIKVLAGTTRNVFGTVIARNHPAYGLVLGATTRNSFGTVIVDQDGTDGDPGIHIGSGAKHNWIGTACVRSHTYGVILGEGTAPTDNDYNVIESLYVWDCSHAGVFIDAGSYNRFGRIIARDCGTADVAISKALLAFQPAGSASVVGNAVEWIEHRMSGESDFAPPLFLVRCGPGSRDNTVLDGYAGHVARDVADLGANRISLRHPERRTQVETFDAGFVGGSPNRTSGQYIEGSGGWRCVGAPNQTSMRKLFTPKDLSGSEEDWFRIFCFVEHSDDRPDHAFTIRAQTGITSHFQLSVPADVIETDGPQYVSLRRSSFSTTGDADWSRVIGLVLWVGSAGRSEYAVTFDDLVVTSDRFGADLAGPIRPFGGAPGDVRVAAGKLWVNDDGTWKSVAVT